MAVYAFCSAKGAPGVSTATLLSAALWARPALVVDADPAGGDAAIRLQDDDPDAAPGLLALLTAARHGLGTTTVVEHTRTLAGGLRVVAGLGSPEQALATAPSWPVLAEAVATAGTETDVLVDAGRLGAPLSSPTLPLLRVSDVVVLVLNAEVAAVTHTRTRLLALADALHGNGSAPLVGVLVVGGRRRDADDAAAAVLQTARAAGLAALDLPRLPHDAAGAAVFAGTPGARPERTGLVRAGRTLVPALAEAGSRSARSSA